MKKTAVHIFFTIALVVFILSIALVICGYYIAIVSMLISFFCLPAIKPKKTISSGLDSTITSAIASLS